MMDKLKSIGIPCLTLAIGITFGAWVMNNKNKSDAATQRMRDTISTAEGYLDDIDSSIDRIEALQKNR